MPRLVRVWAGHVQVYSGEEGRWKRDDITDSPSGLGHLRGPQDTLGSDHSLTQTLMPRGTVTQGALPVWSLFCPNSFIPSTGSSLKM